MQNKIYLFTGLFVVIITAILSLFKGKYYINMSSSVPLGIYKIEKNKPPLKHDIVLLKVPPELRMYIYDRKWLPREWPLLKIVGGEAGDTYCYSGNRFSINGKDVGEIMAVDNDGLPLPKLSGCHSVKSNNFLPIATSIPTSFDARYFGDISQNYIIGVAVPVFTH